MTRERCIIIIPLAVPVSIVFLSLFDFIELKKKNKLGNDTIRGMLYDLLENYNLHHSQLNHSWIILAQKKIIIEFSLKFVIKQIKLFIHI